MSIRSKALSWWRSLGFEEQDSLIVKHFGNIEPIVVRTSTSKIESIFIAEIPIDKFDSL